jgi:hypothetical protein
MANEWDDGMASLCPTLGLAASDEKIARAVGLAVLDWLDANPNAKPLFAGLHWQEPRVKVNNPDADSLIRYVVGEHAKVALAGARPKVRLVQGAIKVYFAARAAGKDAWVAWMRSVKEKPPAPPAPPAGTVEDRLAALERLVLPRRRA